MKMWLNTIFSKFGLKNMILFIYALLLIFMVGSITLISYIWIEGSIRKDIENNLLQTNSQFNTNMDYTFAIYENVINILCVNDYLMSILQKTDGDAFDSYVASQEVKKILSVQNLYPDIIKIEIFPENADYLINNDTFLSKATEPDWYGQVVNKQPYFTHWKHVRNKEFYGRSNGDAIQISKQIVDYQHERFLGVIRINLKMDIVNKLLEAYSQNGNSVAIFDENMGVFFASEDYQSEMTDAFKNIRLQSRSGISDADINGKRMVIIYNGSNRAGLTLANFVPIKSSMEKISSLQYSVIVISLAVILLGLFFDYIISNYITKGITKLVSKIKVVSSGNLDIAKEKSIYSKDEIGYLNQQFDHMVEKVNILFKDVYEAEIKQKEIELKALQAQINPHFLYNTLSSINWMAVDIQATNISHAINLLAKYYRLTLNKGREIIPVFDEIEQVKAYVDIQFIRFKDKFEVEYDIDPDVYKYSTPKLILQPFVENAIIHGFECLSCKGEINVCATVTESEIEFKIKDNGIGMCGEKLVQITTESLSGSGYGVRNVIEKIILLYGREFGVNIESNPEKGTEVLIRIPKIQLENG